MPADVRDRLHPPLLAFTSAALHLPRAPTGLHRVRRGAHVTLGFRRAATAIRRYSAVLASTTCAAPLRPRRRTGAIVVDDSVFWKQNPGLCVIAAPGRRWQTVSKSHAPAH